jgi:hypothetical protein
VKRCHGSTIWLTFLPAIAAATWIAGCDWSSAGASSDARLTGDTAVTVDSSSGQKPKLLPGAKTKVLAKAGDKSYDKTFDDLRFDIKPGQPFEREMLPDSIEAMAGQRIRIRGFMLPTAQSRGIREFVLVRDNQECCFGPGAAIFDCILVEMRPGTTTEYSFRPIAVDGTFDIQEFRGPDGTHLAIFHLAAESAK